MPRHNRHSKTLVKLIESNFTGSVIGVEVGVLEAANAKYLLEKIPSLFLHLVDSYVAMPRNYDRPKGFHMLGQDEVDAIKHRAVRLMQNYRNRIEWHIDPSAIAAQRFDLNSADFVFIDADHEYEAIEQDIRFWWPKVKPGGILSGHDIGTKYDIHGWWGITRAVTEFCNREQREYHTEEGRVWWIKKPQS